MSPHKKSMHTFYSLFLATALIMVSSPLRGQDDNLMSSDYEEVSQRKHFSHVSTFFERLVKKNRVPGAVCLIYKNGKTLLHDAYGMRDIKEGIPMDKNDLFAIASMTKPIVSVATMQLVEQGKVSLEDPISIHLPFLADQVVSVDGKTSDSTYAVKNPITVRHLLTHTAGLSHGFGQSPLNREYFMKLFMTPHQTIASRVKAFSPLPLLAEPGEKWIYSSATDVLALLVETVSDMPLDKYLQEHIFDPLGMTATGYNISDEHLSDASIVYQKNDEGNFIKSIWSPPYQNNTVFGGTHGLYSNSYDYLQFCKMLLNYGELNGTRILQKKTVRNMITDHVGDKFHEEGFGFGLGFGINTDPESEAGMGAYGWSGIYGTWFTIDPVNNMICIMMLQVASDPNDLKKRIGELIYWE